MYKVVFTVLEVKDPESLDGEPTHVQGEYPASYGKK